MHQTRIFKTVKYNCCHHISCVTDVTPLAHEQRSDLRAKRSTSLRSAGLTYELSSQRGLPRTCVCADSHSPVPVNRSINFAGKRRASAVNTTAITRFWDIAHGRRCRANNVASSGTLSSVRSAQLFLAKKSLIRRQHSLWCTDTRYLWHLAVNNPVIGLLVKVACASAYWEETKWSNQVSSPLELNCDCYFFLRSNFKIVITERVLWPANITLK